MTPRVLQLARRLHHEHGWKAPRETVRVEAGQIVELLNAMWAEVQRADTAEARLSRGKGAETAAERLDDLLGPLAQVEPAEGPQIRPAPPRQLNLLPAPSRPIALPDGGSV